MRPATASPSHMSFPVAAKAVLATTNSKAWSRRAAPAPDPQSLVSFPVAAKAVLATTKSKKQKAPAPASQSHNMSFPVAAKAVLATTKKSSRGAAPVTQQQEQEQQKQKISKLRVTAAAVLAATTRPLSGNGMTSSEMSALMKVEYGDQPDWDLPPEQTLSDYLIVVRAHPNGFIQSYPVHKVLLFFGSGYFKRKFMTMKNKALQKEKQMKKQKKQQQPHAEEEVMDPEEEQTVFELEELTALYFPVLLDYLYRKHNHAYLPASIQKKKRKKKRGKKEKDHRDITRDNVFPLYHLGKSLEVPNLLVEVNRFWKKDLTWDSLPEYYNNMILSGTLLDTTDELIRAMIELCASHFLELELSNPIVQLAHCPFWVAVLDCLVDPQPPEEDSDDEDEEPDEDYNEEDDDERTYKAGPMPDEDDSKRYWSYLLTYVLRAPPSVQNYLDENEFQALTHEKYLPVIYESDSAVFLMHRELLIKKHKLNLDDNIAVGSVDPALNQELTSLQHRCIECLASCDPKNLMDVREAFQQQQYVTLKPSKPLESVSMEADDVTLADLLVHSGSLFVTTLFLRNLYHIQQTGGLPAYQPPAQQPKKQSKKKSASSTNKLPVQ